MRTLSDAIGADDLKWISGYVSLKEASSLALWWHQDWWCWDHCVSYRREAPQIAALCYLADTDAHNGGLRLLPGSHLKSGPIHSRLPEAHSQMAETLEPGNIVMTDLPDQVTPGMRAGDAVAIDYRLLHGTHPNQSSARRDCILLSFTPSWRRLPDDVKAHLVDHPALPQDDDPEMPAAMSHLLPTFDGVRQTLALNRNAPREFTIPDEK
jgi:ectoine hydroxylase-related dioxygenase (phytanoyl-CoA dioxygenase family)